MPDFPLLPIVTRHPDRKTNAEKYGGLYYLSIAGLTVLVLMIVWFAAGVWSMWSIWADVYTVSDGTKSEVERVNAAWRLAHDSRTTDRQKWDLAINRKLPPIARYLLAESMTAEATTTDPRGYALSAARSDGWPPWLRALIARPLAYASATGYSVDRESLQELAGNSERFAALWGEFALIQSLPSTASTPTEWLRPKSLQNDAERSFCESLRAATKLTQPRLSESLDRATASLRELEPSAKQLWSDWNETPTGMIPIKRAQAGADERN